MIIILQDKIGTGVFKHGLTYQLTNSLCAVSGNHQTVASLQEMERGIV